MKRVDYSISLGVGGVLANYMRSMLNDVLSLSHVLNKKLSAGHGKSGFLKHRGGHGSRQKRSLTLIKK